MTSSIRRVECSGASDESACADDESRDDQGGDGDWSNRVVLTAGTAGAMLLLFIDDDWPSYLELAPIDDDLSCAEFPDPALVEV